MSTEQPEAEAKCYMTTTERWAVDEEIGGWIAPVPGSVPRWVEDDLGHIYGPDAPPILTMDDVEPDATGKRA